MVCQLSPGARQAAAARCSQSCGSVAAAGDIASGVLLADADGFGAQACHAEAVVGKQIIGQWDGLLVLPLVIALSAQQAVGAGVENDRAFRPVKAELVVGGGMLGIERHIERRVEADAEAQLLRAGVRHLQSRCW